MSLVILDANLGEELGAVVLLKLMDKLKIAVDSHIEGRDREETIGAICSEIKNIVRVVGYVASSSEFTKQPAIVNGASELLLEIFGESGKHARSAVGVAVLPLNASVEIELTVEI